MKIPHFLKKGGTIGFAAPSFGCTTEPYKTCFKRAEKKFNESGYRTVEGPDVFRDDGTGISSTPENCGLEFTEMYLSGENDVIMSCGGGELMCEILDHVDFNAVKEASPRWFCGYSDNTNLILPLAVICDTASIYGPCAPAFGGIWDESGEKRDPRIDLMNLITGRTDAVANYDKWEAVSLKTPETPVVPYNLTEDTCISGFLPCENKDSEAVISGRVIKGVERKEHLSFSGRLLGGCLDCLQALCGTKYDRVRDFSEKYKEDGIIWFLESCDLNLMGIRRALWQLGNAGWFSNARGFIIGRPLKFNEESFGISRFEAFLEPLKKYGVPVIMDADIGHLPPQMPVVSGAYADVKFSSLRDLCLEETVEPGRQLILRYNFSI